MFLNYPLSYLGIWIELLTSDPRRVSFQKLFILQEVCKITRHCPYKTEFCDRLIVAVGLLRKTKVDEDTRMSLVHIEIELSRIA